MKDIGLHERRGATSLWRIVTDTIQREISGGRYKPGDRLPTEAELAEAFTLDIEAFLDRHEDIPFFRSTMLET